MSEGRSLQRRQLKAAGYRGKKARRRNGRNEQAIREVAVVKAVKMVNRMTPKEVEAAATPLRRQRSWRARLWRWLTRG